MFKNVYVFKTAKDRLRVEAWRNGFKQAENLFYFMKLKLAKKQWIGENIFSLDGTNHAQAG